MLEEHVTNSPSASSEDPDSDPVVHRIKKSTTGCDFFLHVSEFILVLFPDYLLNCLLLPSTG